MPTNRYFNKFEFSREQDLFHSLVNEVIQIHGVDVQYVPRTLNNLDVVFEEDSTPSFENSFQVEMYIKESSGFGGEGDILSKFGLQINDRVTFAVARRAFGLNVTRYANTITRPREGDLIYFPLNKKTFEIRFVEHESMFYNAGDLYVYELQCELFEYSHETLDTNFANIDFIEDTFTLDIYKHAIMTQDGFVLATQDSIPILQQTYLGQDRLEQDEDNEILESEAEEILDFSERDPFSEREY